MAYCDTNYKTKRAMKEDFKNGVQINVHQPGGVFTPEVENGRIAIEGPHYPKPHRWYASVEVLGGKIIKIYG